MELPQLTSSLSSLNDSQLMQVYHMLNAQAVELSNTTLEDFITFDTNDDAVMYTLIQALAHDVLAHLKGFHVPCPHCDDAGIQEDEHCSLCDGSHYVSPEVAAEYAAHAK
jgi:hypothetical protein